MFRACLIARVSRRWCVVQTPVNRRGTILPRSATNPCSRRTSRYGIASIFSVQNLHTFLRRKNLPRPPGPPEGRPPERGPEPGPPGPGPDEACGADAGALASGALLGVSSDMLFPLHSLCFPLSMNKEHRNAVIRVATEKPQTGSEATICFRLKRSRGPIPQPQLVPAPVCVPLQAPEWSCGELPAGP